MTTTRSLPCHPVVDGVPTFLDFTGSDCGPFFIHRGRPDGKEWNRFMGWTVTHVATGYAVKTGIRTRVRAVELARKLRVLDCWGFVTAASVKDLPAETLAQIHELRDAA